MSKKSGMKDTPLADIEYGKTIQVIVAGRQVTRFFKILHCEFCHAQLTARLIASGPRQGLLYSAAAHNKRRVCDRACQDGLSRRRQQRQRAVPKVQRPTGQWVSGWQIV